MTTILITGAQGYIGQRFSALAEAAGHAVRDAGSWRLGETPPQGIFAGVDAVVHLAHSWRNETAGSENINLAGSEKLARTAFTAGIRRFIFVSSVSADPMARNLYGRIKYATEERLLGLPDSGQSVICARVGLVYGGEAKGQYGVMRKLARFSVLPMIGLAREVQPIHLDEVSAALLTLATGPAPARPVYVLAAPRPMVFARWLRLLRQAQTGSPSMLLIALPIGLVLLAARLLAALPGAPRIDRERILGLAGTRFRPSSTDLESLELALTDPAARLISARFAVRENLREGMTLLHYLLGRRAPRKSVIRFARLMKRQSETPLGLPAPVRIVPALLRLFDPGGRQTALTRHLQIAAMIAETIPGARANIVLQILWEVFAAPIRLAAWRILR